MASPAARGVDETLGSYQVKSPPFAGVFPFDGCSLKCNFAPALAQIQALAESGDVA